MGRIVGRTLFAVLFVAGGANHLIMPALYLKIMPSYLPWPRELVWLSGMAEIVLGALLLYRPTRILAAWGLVALLVAVFPANLWMWQHPEQYSIPPLALFLRLPLQGVLIAWAWLYTRPPLATVDRSSSRMPWAAGVALMLAMLPVGCGIGGPRLDRLKDGSMARARNPESRPITVFFAASQETLAPGTVVKVVSDQYGTVNQVDRMVIVGFSDGPHQGLAGQVRRNDLEPDR